MATGVRAAPRYGLARSLWVLGACEGMNRTGRLDWRLSGVVHHGGGVPELRALPTKSVVAELVELAGRARALDLVGHRRDIVEELLLRERDEDSTVGVAAPVPIPGWIERDLLIGSPRATMLVDVKTAAGGLYDTQRSPDGAGNCWHTPVWTPRTCTASGPWPCTWLDSAS